MSIHFGQLGVRVRKVVYYTLSSADQRFWVKSISHGFPNLVKKSIYMALPIIPSALFSIWCVTWSNAAHKRYLRKDPKMYENDT